MFWLVFVLIASAIPPMILWSFAHWLFPRSVLARALVVFAGFALVFAWKPEILAIYFFLVPLLGFGIIVVFERILTKDRQSA
ncbi:MAG: hypothetical protein WA918_01470 [Erythrobacter sp.]